MHVPAALRAEGIIASSKTWLRWKIHGVNGAKLETIKVGGRLFTSRAAVLRFVEAQQREAPPAQQTLDARAADVVLAAHGLRREAKP